MKLIGGNFGASGTVRLTRDNKFVISGAESRKYNASDITDISAAQHKERKFGVFGFIVGLLLFGTIGYVIANIIGLIIALAITIAGSFYSEKSNVVTATLIDGKTVIFNATESQVKDLYSAKSKPMKMQ